MAIHWSIGIALGLALGSCSDPERTPASAEEATAGKYSTTEAVDKDIDAQNVDEPKGVVPSPMSSVDFTFGFEAREHQLWLHTGTEPQLYTVKAKDGSVVADAIDDERLKRDYPELHEIVHEGVDFIGIGY